MGLGRSPLEPQTMHEMKCLEKRALIDKHHDMDEIHTHANKVNILYDDKKLMEDRFLRRQARLREKKFRITKKHRRMQKASRRANRK